MWSYTQFRCFALGKTDRSKATFQPTDVLGEKMILWSQSLVWSRNVFPLFATCHCEVNSFFCKPQGHPLPHNPFQVVQAWNLEGHTLIHLNCVHSVYLTNVFWHPRGPLETLWTVHGCSWWSQKNSIHVNSGAMNYRRYHPMSKWKVGHRDKVTTLLLGPQESPERAKISVAPFKRRHLEVRARVRVQLLEQCSKSLLMDDYRG